MWKNISYEDAIKSNYQVFDLQYGNTLDEREATGSIEKRTLKMIYDDYRKKYQIVNLYADTDVLTFDDVLRIVEDDVLFTEDYVFVDGNNRIFIVLSNMEHSFFNPDDTELKLQSFYGYEISRLDIVDGVIEYPNIVHVDVNIDGTVTKTE